MLTKDSVTVSVDAVVYYRVSNATVSVANVENAHHSTRLLAQTTLRNVLGTKNLSEILSERESISASMQVCTHTLWCLFDAAPVYNKTKSCYIVSYCGVWSRVMIGIKVLGSCDRSRMTYNGLES